ncbi:hypothetical protein HPB50_009420 [Hyalomma asiaticum]|uniref:Uncharacterized protein n=1 Tax=Hyalomma asiaticum TaxID=266040 RepID=A0ACB7RWB6_HYAAI|nr:hypothetical protein HPB50_009420 [Hyalomma asiaticum]
MGSEFADFKRDIRKEIRELNKSLDFMNKDYENIKQECAEVKKGNAALRASQEAMQCEIDHLRKLVHENATRLTAQDQCSRNKNVEIKGIPRAANENLVQLLAKALGEPISEQDIEICHRLPARGAASQNNIPKDRGVAKSNEVRPHECVDSDRGSRVGSDTTLNENIVVVFSRRDKRDAIVKKARRIRFTADELGFTTKQSVFVNEHLCPQLKKLLGMTISRKREMNWRFAWASGGKIFARETETSRAVQITCEADLQKMRAAASSSRGASRIH